MHFPHQGKRPSRQRINPRRPVAPPFRTPHKLDPQQVATRSKGALVSIGNSPEEGRPTSEEDRLPGQNPPTPDEDDRGSADGERPPAPAAGDSSWPGESALLTTLSTDEEEIDEDLGVGRTLHRARVDAGLTVDDVSAATRVRIPIVHAIEDDDFSRCGGDVYARGHVKTLARAVGLDPEPLLARFDAEHGTSTGPTPATPLFEAERIRPERRSPNWTAAMVAAIVVVIGFVGFTLVQGSGPDHATKPQTAKGAGPATTSAAPQPSVTTPSAPTPAPTDSAIAAAPRDKVTVVVSAPDGRSWISAKDHNGQLLFDGLLEKGQQKTFQDNQKIDLILGDAGSIQLFVNGKKIDNEFQPGQVERLSYTKGDPEAG
jgi:cytoskeleton protein RodZ